MTATTKYGYYLANGSYVEYDLLPDSSLIDIIDRLALAYLDAGHCIWPFLVWMQPACVSRLCKELALCRVNVTGYISNPTAMELVRIETPAGPIVVLVKPQLTIPIFIGSEKELEDNNFSAEMDKILA